MMIAVNFHYVRPVFDGRYEAIYGSTPAEFAEQLETLGGIGTFVSADEVRDAVQGRTTLPTRAIVITIDDGLREQYEHAWPVLTRLSVPAIFYVNTAPIIEGRVSSVHKIHLLRSELAPADFVALLRRYAADDGIDLGRPVDPARALLQYEYDTEEVACLKFLLNLILTSDQRDRLIECAFEAVFPGGEPSISHRLYMDGSQLRELGRHRVLGTHGHEHLPLGSLDAARAKEQLRVSMQHLESAIGYRPFTLSYPFGEHDACSPDAAAAAAALGIEFAFTMERAANHDMRAPLHLARFDSNDAPGGKRPYWPAAEFFDRAPAAAWHRISRDRATSALSGAAR